MAHLRRGARVVAEVGSDEARASTREGAGYVQPTPRLLYVHDDLTDEVSQRFGPSSAAAALARELFALMRREGDRVRVLTLSEQLDRVVAQGSHAPFHLALAIGAAGERVARSIHARAAWFPRIRRIGLTREEDGRGGYRLISTEATTLAAQVRGIETCRSLAIVDDTVFSGLTMQSVIQHLPDSVRSRTHAFCFRGAAASIDAIAALCPITAGVSAPGRLLDDVSFINASGLVLRISIRRSGQAPLAFFDRPEWIHAWFPASGSDVIAHCRELHAMLSG